MDFIPVFYVFKLCQFTKKKKFAGFRFRFSNFHIFHEFLFTILACVCILYVFVSYSFCIHYVFISYLDDKFVKLDDKSRNMKKLQKSNLKT